MMATKSYTRELNNVSDTETKQYLLIPKETLKSKVYRDLSASAKVTYFGLLTFWIRKKVNRKLNHKVKVSYSKLMIHTGLSETTLWRALKELENKEFTFGNITHNKYSTNEYKLNTIYLDMNDKKLIPEATLPKVIKPRKKCR